MTIPVKLPHFQEPPKEYDPKYFADLIKSLRLYMQLINAEGEVHCSELYATLPESADGAGLRIGTIYHTAGAVKVKV